MKRRTTRRRVIMIFADIDALFDAFTRGGFQSFSPMKLSSIELSHDESFVNKRTHMNKHAIEQF